MSWYCVRTATRQEDKAAASLKEAKFEAYLPLMVRWAWRAHSSRKVRVAQPLFVGYLFVRLDPPERFDLVTDCHGVHAFLRHSLDGLPPEPAKIPARLVDALMQAEAAGEFDRTRDRDASAYRPGEMVSIVKGHFTDWPARVIAMDGASRVRLLVTAFGRQHEKTLAVDSLRAA